MSRRSERSGVHLVRSHEDAHQIAAAQDRYGSPVGLRGVLGDLNRRATQARVPGRAASWGFRWNRQDDASGRWWPQGISTSADATGGDAVAGRRLLVTSWYSKGGPEDNHGSRLTFVDLDRMRYRHVLIVRIAQDPLGRTVFRPLRIHAGGVVWCGPYLHLAGTARGIFTCHVEDIMRVELDNDTFGYRYVLPVRLRYDAGSQDETQQLRYSFLSLDRGVDPPELLAGEYARAGQSTRLARYPLDARTLHLEQDEEGCSRPAVLDERGVGHMQGAVVVEGTYYVTVSRGEHRPGHLYIGTPGALRPHRWVLPPGPEDISYWSGLDQLWSLSEYPGRRFVFAVDRSAVDGSRSRRSHPWPR